MSAPPPKPWERNRAQAGTSSSGTPSAETAAAPWELPQDAAATASNTAAATAAAASSRPARPWEAAGGVSTSGAPGSSYLGAQQYGGVGSSYGVGNSSYNSPYGGGGALSSSYSSPYNSGGMYGGSGMYGAGSMGGMYGAGGSMYGRTGTYGSSMYGSGGYGSSMYGTGGYGSSMYGAGAGGYGNSMYGGGMGYNRPMGYGTGGMYGGGDAYGGMQPGMMPPGPFDPNHPPQPPSTWQHFMAGINGVMHFFGRMSFLVDENAHAVHFFISALLQLLDRAGSLYGEIARFILRVLFRRRRRGPPGAKSPRPGGLEGAKWQSGPPGQQGAPLALPAPGAVGVAGPPSGGHWDNIWTDN